MVWVTRLLKEKLTLWRARNKCACVSFESGFGKRLRAFGLRVSDGKPVECKPCREVCTSMGSDYNNLVKPSSEGFLLELSKPSNSHPDCPTTE